jgi:hypothetical protein
LLLFPALTGNNPDTALSSVDFPEPFGPTSATLVPAGTRRLTSRSASPGVPA